jgi:hypothetical protein
MPDITDLPIISDADAKAIGFAGFNDVPHKPIDIPDGGFTITARTSEGRRVTFSFLPERQGGPARFVDIQYHDRDSVITKADCGQSPTFDSFAITRGGRHIVDSRPLKEDGKPVILVVLLDRAGDTDAASTSPTPAKADTPVFPEALREVSWTFDGETIYPGYTNDKTWNGFLDISVDEATWRYVLPALIAGADGNRESLAAIAAMTLKDGRVSLAYGLTTSEADTWWPTQFPDYPVASMPPIPADWTDKSWRNDTAPSFQVCTGPMAEPVEMWIDYRDPALREIAGMPRFGLYRRGGDNELAAIYTGEDYDEAMEHAGRETFACMFTKALAGALSSSQWRTMRITNRTIAPGACASHDHIDANMVMHATWLSLRGEKLLALGRITDVGDDLDFINAGWAIARAHYLTATDEGACFDAWRTTGRKVPDLAAAGCETGSDDPAPRPGRMYEPGHIEMAPNGRWIVNVGNSSRGFSSLIEAEGHLWRAFAALESDYCGVMTAKP